MKIYTSYFAQTKKLATLDIVPIGIARYAPKWFSGDSYKHIAPTSKMFKMTYREYVKAFNTILAGLDPKEVVNDLRRLSGGKDIALLCYEKPDDFCHRHLVGKWLKDSLGIEIVELNNEDKDLHSNCMLFLEPETV